MFPYNSSDHANAKPWSNDASADMTFISGFGSASDASNSGHHISAGPVIRGHQHGSTTSTGHQATGPYMDVFSYDSFGPLLPSVSSHTQGNTVAGSNHFWNEQPIGQPLTTPGNPDTRIVHDEPSYFSRETYGDTIFNNAAAGVLKHVETNMANLILNRLKSNEHYQSPGRLASTFSNTGQAGIESAFANTGLTPSSGVINSTFGGVDNNSSVGSVSGHVSIPSSSHLNHAALSVGSAFENDNNQRIETGSSLLPATSTSQDAASSNNITGNEHFWGKQALGQPLLSQSIPYNHGVRSDSSYFTRESYEDTIFNSATASDVLKQVENNMANLSLSHLKSNDHYSSSQKGIGSVGTAFAGIPVTSSSISSVFGGGVVDSSAVSAGRSGSGAAVPSALGNINAVGPGNLTLTQFNNAPLSLKSIGSGVDTAFESSPARLDSANTGTSSSTAPSNISGEIQKPSWASVASQPAKPQVKPLKPKTVAQSITSIKQVTAGTSNTDKFGTWEGKTVGNGSAGLSGDSSGKFFSGSSVMQASGLTGASGHQSHGRLGSNYNSVMGSNSGSMDSNVPNSWSSLPSQGSRTASRNMANNSLTYNGTTTTSTNSPSVKQGVINSVSSYQNGQGPGEPTSNQITNNVQQQNGSQSYQQQQQKAIDVSHTKPTNLWSYNGLRVVNVSSSCPKSTLLQLFGKYGRVKQIERINKTLENSIWVYYDNPVSPVEAAHKLQGAIVDGVSLDGLPLRIHFAPTDDQKDLKFSRPKQPPDNKGECYYWRTTNCFSREQCPLLHIPANKNIDAQIWMKMNKEQPQPISSSSAKSK